MKLRVRRGDLIQAVHFFNEQLASEFGMRAWSVADQERIQRRLVELQRKKQMMETTNVWKTPLCVKFEQNGMYHVDIANERGILIMD